MPRRKRPLGMNELTPPKWKILEELALRGPSDTKRLSDRGITYSWAWRVLREFEDAGLVSQVANKDRGHYWRPDDSPAKRLQRTYALTPSGITLFLTKVGNLDRLQGAHRSPRQNDVDGQEEREQRIRKIEKAHALWNIARMHIPESIRKTILVHARIGLFLQIDMYRTNKHTLGPGLFHDLREFDELFLRNAIEVGLSQIDWTTVHASRRYKKKMGHRSYRRKGSMPPWLIHFLKDLKREDLGFWAMAHLRIFEDIRKVELEAIRAAQAKMRSASLLETRVSYFVPLGTHSTAL
jgi:DNA-binding MarR family transcriptional regulator